MKSNFTFISFSLFLFLSLSLNAQITTSSQWTWVNGANTVNQPGVYGSQGIDDAANHPGARGGKSASWKDAAGNFWLFGGYDYSNAYLNDLWKYNPAMNQWTWIKGASTTNQVGTYGTKGTADPANTPGARYQSATWTDEAGNFWLFGGYGFAAVNNGGYVNLNDLWKYNPADNQWTWVSGANANNEQGVYGTMGTADAANRPGARYGSTSWTDAAGNLWLFGGLVFSASGINYFNDLWKYETSTNLWTWVNGANTLNEQGTYGTMGTENLANRPGARNESVSWSDAAGNLWLFGGTVNTGSSSVWFNDLWKYSTVTNQWTWVNGANTVNQQGTYGTQGSPADDNRPGARSAGIKWTDSEGNFWLFGGYGYASSSLMNGYLNDLWKYNPTTNQWTWMKGANTTSQQGIYGTVGTSAADNRPGARAPSASWIDETGNFWLFGGANGAGLGFLNDLWKLTPGGVLPVTLSSLKAYQLNSNIAVEWKVANETGITKYEVDKSSDGILFSKAGVLVARDNNMSTVKYSWMDLNAKTGNNFYRIRSTSISGEIKYSPVVKVSVGKGRPGYEIYPNPVTDNMIQLQFINQPKGIYTLQLLNTSGQLMMANQIAHEGGSSTEVIKLNNLITKGQYALIITASGKSRHSIKIIH